MGVVGEKSKFRMAGTPSGARKINTSGLCIVAPFVLFIYLEIQQSWLIKYDDGFGQDLSAATIHYVHIFSP